MMDLLGIKELRPGEEKDANWDESKANVYPKLPDPLVEKNGKRVTTAEEWWKERRPEIVEDYDREVLGRTPANLPKVSWEVVSTTKESIGDVAVVTKRLAGHVDNSSYPQIEVTIDATLTTPARAAGKVPVMMELAFPGEFKASLARPISDTGSGALGDYGQAWERQVLAKGWGFAVLSPTSYQADDGAGMTEGIIGLVNKGQPRTLEDWGGLKAWAWGASRLWITLRRTRPWTQGVWGLKATRAWASRRWWRWRTIRGLRCFTPVRRARAGRSFTGTFMASRSAISSRNSITGWAETC